MSWDLDLHLVGRIVLGALVGLAIGAEREWTGHEAGIRTFAVLATGAAAFGAISTDGFDGGPGTRADITRVASQVVVGVGFLGAGLIFRQGAAVQNLTTAAALWATAAAGVAAGVGHPALAVTVAAVILVLLVVGSVELGGRWTARLPVTRRLRCRLRTGTSAGLLRDRLDDAEMTVVSWEVSKEDGRVVVAIELRGRAPVMDRFLPRLVDSDLVTDVAVLR